MSGVERARLLAVYDERLRVHGYDQQTLGWNKPKSALRFEMLLDYFVSAGGPRYSLLDFGCGFGDLFAFCRARSYAVDYHGIDINPNLIEVARRAHPGADFSVGDPLVDGLARDYDIIVASGTHNFAIAAQAAVLERTFEVFARHSACGFALNFLSDRVTFRRPENAYTSPAQALDVALRHTSRILLRHDYMPFEFTLVADMRDRYDVQNTVYPEFMNRLDSASCDGSTVT